MAEAAAKQARARQGEQHRPRCARCRALLRARRSTATYTYYYCRSAGCRKLPSVKLPRPIWTAFGLTPMQERAMLLSRIAAIDKALAYAGKEEITRGSGGDCA